MSYTSRVTVAWGVLLTLFTATACSPSSLVDVQSPSTVVDPSQVKTPTAAIQLYNAALLYIERPLAGYGIGYDVIGSSGLFTDELSITYFGPTGIDERNVSLPSNTENTNGQLYTTLHQARIGAQQARQALQLYASNSPNAPTAWQGQLFALEGYTVLWFAELFCSGIPLTSVPLVGPQVPTRGFTTQELYEHAITLFDSAIVAGNDSARFVNLARVGKGRALLGLGRFAAADSAVQGVPLDFVYQVEFSPSGNYQNDLVTFYQAYRAQDHEGGNGLDWSDDPRTAIVTLPSASGVMLRPSKYFVTASGTLNPTSPRPGAPVRLADGLEAQLIHAEAMLAAGDASWLVTLNDLRATCIGTAACAPVPNLTAAALPPLADPGTPAARIDTLMKERAMWLYLTGHREGDLRRMARLYQRDPSTLWPTGIISSPAFPPLYSTPPAINGTPYGQDVVFLPSANEKKNNPLYGGCYDTNP